ncbi:MAG: hypothetical protein IKK75_11180 [Clostridia bacterium]|nr:hypothetical protein [Clostridia bacterium]
MRHGKMFSLLLVLCLLLILCGNALAARPLPEYIMVTVDEAEGKNDYADPWSGFSLYRLGEILYPTGETGEDSDGKLWYAFDDGGHIKWICSDDCMVADRLTCLDNHPYKFDEFVFGSWPVGSMKQDEKTGKWINLFGHNDREQLVDWFIECYSVADAYGGSVAVPEFVCCSWTNNVNPLDGYNYEMTPIWQLLLNNETASITRRDSRTMMERLHWDTKYSINHLYLPDDPSIAGPQEVVYKTADELLTFRFVLEYKGGYSGEGLGWGFENIVLTRSPINN